jgi:hypothetical protein
MNYLNKTNANSRLSKAGVWYPDEIETLNSSFPAEAGQVVHLMMFSAEKPCLRKEAKR